MKPHLFYRQQQCLPKEITFEVVVHLDILLTYFISNRFHEDVNSYSLKRQLATTMRLARGQMTIVFSRFVNKFPSVPRCHVDQEPGFGKFVVVVVATERTSLPVTSVFFHSICGLGVMPVTCLSMIMLNWQNISGLGTFQL